MAKDKTNEEDINTPDTSTIEDNQGSNVDSNNSDDNNSSSSSNNNNIIDKFSEQNHQELKETIDTREKQAKYQKSKINKEDEPKEEKEETSLFSWFIILFGVIVAFIVLFKKRANTEGLELTESEPTERGTEEVQQREEQKTEPVSERATWG